MTLLVLVDLPVRGQEVPEVAAGPGCPWQAVVDVGAGTVERPVRPDAADHPALSAEVLNDAPRDSSSA